MLCCKNTLILDKKLSETGVIKLFDFFYSQPFVTATNMYGGRAFQHKVRIPMGIHCAPRRLVPLFV